MVITFIIDIWIIVDRRRVSYFHDTFFLIAEQDVVGFILKE